MHSFKLSRKVVVSENPCRLFRIGKQLPYKRLLVCIAYTYGPVLRRIRRRRNISVLLFTVNKILKPKSSIFFHHGIYVGAKIVRVLGKRIIIKAILHHPRGCRRRPAPVEIPPGTSPTEGRILSMAHPSVLGIFFIGNDIVVTPRGKLRRGMGEKKRPAEAINKGIRPPEKPVA